MSDMTCRQGKRRGNNPNCRIHLTRWPVTALAEKHRRQDHHPWLPGPHASPWYSGELLRYYADWRIESCAEEIFDCMSSGIPYKHAENRIVARQPAG